MQLTVYKKLTHLLNINKKHHAHLKLREIYHVT